MDFRPFTRNLWINLATIGISVAYGIVIRLVFGLSGSSHPLAAQVSWIMTIAFLFRVPFVMGFLAVAARFQLQREADGKLPSVFYWIFFPWLPAIATMLIAALF